MFDELVRHNFGAGIERDGCHNCFAPFRMRNADHDDFPHEPTEHALMHDIPNFLARNDLDEAAKGKILYHNAKRLYGIA